MEVDARSVGATAEREGADREVNIISGFEVGLEAFEMELGGFQYVR